MTGVKTQIDTRLGEIRPEKLWLSGCGARGEGIAKISDIEGRAGFGASGKQGNCKNI
jgi:hypothetical protein